MLVRMAIFCSMLCKRETIILIFQYQQKTCLKIRKMIIVIAKTRPPIRNTCPLSAPNRANKLLNIPYLLTFTESV